MATRGKIYILRNPYLQDSLVKVGKTSRMSEERAKELSTATGVPGKFEVLFEEDVFDVDLAERLAHEALATYRANPQREFFRVPLKIAVRRVSEISRALETIEKGHASPRIVIFMTGTADAKNLKGILEPHRGGAARVTIVYENGPAKAEFDLGDDWRIEFSTDMLRDLKKIGHGVVWTWGLTPTVRPHTPKSAEVSDEVPF